MDPKALAEIAAKAMQAIKDQDGDTALQLLEQLVTILMGGEPASEAPSTPDAATAESADAPVAAANAAAIGGALAKFLGVKTEVEAIAMFSNLRTTVDSLRVQSSAADLVERRGVIAQLVKMGVETPATAWIGDAAKLVPCARLLGEPLADMKARVLVLSAVPRAHEHTPPAGGGDDGAGEGSREIKTPRGAITLSARELEMFAGDEAKISAYAHNKAIREASRVKGTR